MSKKELPTALRQQQEQKKQVTLNKIQQVINELMDMDIVVTKKRLIEETGYSASTFSKRHVKELLQHNRVCQFKETAKVKDTTNSNKRHNELIVQHAEGQVTKLSQEILRKDLKINELEEKNKELEEKYKQLLGVVFALSKKAELMGIELN